MVASSSSPSWLAIPHLHMYPGDRVVKMALTFAMVCCLPATLLALP